jgi:hypothetical protein
MDADDNMNVKESYISDDEEEDPEFARLREEHQREVDLLSLELLSNSKQYKRYISKNHPDEQLKNEEETRRLTAYKPRVAGLFMELLEEYLEPTSTIVNAELQSVFKECVRKMIQHIEWSECNQTSASQEDDYCDPEEDMLFAHAYRPSKRKPVGKHADATTDPFSFWGATIRKSSI